MRVVISQIFNEAYLLPWWLRHHRDLFDHGVLIDYRSTDESVDICRKLAPHWEVVTSENLHFDALMVDFEIMKHEARFPTDWKIALNVTEFLVARSLADVETIVNESGQIAALLPGAVMVDKFPDQHPNTDQPLVLQKYHGIWENTADFDAWKIPGVATWKANGVRVPTRSRIYHCYQIGAYTPGRHASCLPGQQGIDCRTAAIFWYGLSPWCKEFKARKLQIDGRRGVFDKKYGLGFHHAAAEQDLDMRREMLAQHSRALWLAPGIVNSF